MSEPLLMLNNGAGTSFQGLEDAPPTFGQSLSASFNEAWENNPLSNIRAASRVAMANQGAKLGQDEVDQLIGLAKVPGFQLKGDTYTADAAKLLIARRQEQDQRNDILGRTQWDVVGTPVRAAAMATATLLDPLNVASMFVPEIAPARYLAAVGEASGAARFGLRAAQGAAQGAIGMGALEAVNYPLHGYLQDDYTMTNVLTNIMMGATLGGLLHGVGGAVADRWTDYPAALGKVRSIVEQPVELKEAQFKAALAQAIEGRPIDVAPLAVELERSERFQPAADVLRVDPDLHLEMQMIAKNELGWAQEGGRGISTSAVGVDHLGLPTRDSATIGDRTKWVPYSDFWPGRPAGSFTPNEAKAVFDKWVNGDSLGKAERRFIDYMQTKAKERLFGDVNTTEELRAQYGAAENERLAIQSGGMSHDELRAFIDSQRERPEPQLAIREEARGEPLMQAANDAQIAGDAARDATAALKATGYDTTRIERELATMNDLHAQAESIASAYKAAAACGMVR